MAIYPNYPQQNFYANPFYQPQQMPQPMQIQQSGFVSVRTINDVESYPIAPGNSVTFYVETNPPIIATKTKGFSQLEIPVTKYFDLTERKMSTQSAPVMADTPSEGKNISYALKSDLEALWSAVDDLKAQMKTQIEGEHDDV